MEKIENQHQFTDATLPLSLCERIRGSSVVASDAFLVSAPVDRSVRAIPTGVPGCLCSLPPLLVQNLGSSRGIGASCSKNPRSSFFALPLTIA